MQYAPRVSTVTTDADWNFSNLDTNCSWFLRSMFQQRMIANYWKGILANITSLHSHQSIPTMNRTDGFGVSKLLIKWPFFIETSLDGSGKNKKSWFFLLGLKYTLRTCFESKKFLSKSCPELSNQVLSFSEGQIY